LESHDLAWAAGFFDGEGWANRQRRGVNSRINQASLDGVPEVLTKFKRIVGVGRIHGPVLVEGRQPLYYWEATSRPDLVQVVERIGPWLCPVKRAEFERTLGGPLPAPTWPGSMSEELAWAGSFFDGEGSTCLDKHRTHANFFVPVLYVPQAAAVGTAPELLRLQKAIDWAPSRGSGRQSLLVSRTAAGASSRSRRYFSRHMLWPFVGWVKREQARRAMQVVLAQPDLVRGNPAFGAAGARYCLRGHDKWNARIKPFKGRGKNEEDPLNHLRQCLVCVREAAQARRNKKRQP
jgi:hypothetical protein